MIYFYTYRVELLINQGHCSCVPFILVFNGRKKFKRIDAFRVTGTRGFPLADHVHSNNGKSNQKVL